MRLLRVDFRHKRRNENDALLRPVVVNAALKISFDSNISRLTIMTSSVFIAKFLINKPISVRNIRIFLHDTLD